MERAFWLLTWTGYGTRLPGDRRGFVSAMRDGRSPRRRHNTPRTPMDRDIPGLRRSATGLLRGRPVRLSGDHAAVVAHEFQTTARIQSWSLPALAVMWNHVHLVVGLPAPGDAAAAADAMRRLKAYASKAMNAAFGRRERWWTQSGSRRLLPGEPAVIAAIRYVADQPQCLLLVVDEEWAEIAQLESDSRR